VILGLKEVGFEIFNLGGHENITMTGLIEIIEEKIGRKAIIEHHPFAKADMLANLADVSKAGELLGWEPAFGLDEGISRTIEWYNANRDWAKELKIM